jgi:glycine/D-amino acid oxidase-like deaminating enzyme
VTGIPVWRKAPRQPETPLPLRADIVVVGGGITGVSLAHWLGRGGADVLLLERSRLAAGASGRNAGFVLAGVASNYAEAVEKYGRSMAAEIWSFTLENHDRLGEALAGRAGHKRAGSWTLAASTEEAVALQKSAALLSEDRLPGAWRPNGGKLGGLLNAVDGELQPVEAVVAIAAMANAAILDGVEVTGVEPGASGVRVHTSAGELGAGAVVLATNAYSRQLYPEIPIDAVRGQMLATEAGADPVAGRPVYTDSGYVYWRQLPDRRVLVGGFRHRALADEVGYDETPTEAVQAHLEAQLADLDVTTAVSHRWAGIMGFTPDTLPLVGPVPGAPGVFICAGYSGHGMGFAFNCARLLAGSMLSAESVPGWLSPARPGVVV